MVQLELFESKTTNRLQPRERDRRLRSLNLDLTREIEFTKGGMPKVKPTFFTNVPRYWQLFTQAMNLKTRNRHAGVMFYQDDYKFERVWNYPLKYCRKLMDFPCVTSTDFSLYINMPIEIQRWNVFRNRLLSAYWQLQGINVIPSVSWSTKESYGFCFDGLSGGTVMISTVGILKQKETRELWSNGVDEMLKRVEPDSVIVYGVPIDYDFKNTNVTYIDYIYQKGGLNYGR